MPSWFMAMPSHTPMVLICSGVPPAMRTPAFTASAICWRWRCPGITSFCAETTATSGRSSSSSVRPSALSRLRCGARASPFFTASLLSSIHPRFPLRRRAAKRLVKFRKCEVMAWVRRLLRRFPRGRLDGCPSGLSPATQPYSMPVTGAPARHTDEPAARGIARRRHAFSCTARGGVPDQSPRVLTHPRSLWHVRPVLALSSHLLSPASIARVGEHHASAQQMKHF